METQSIIDLMKAMRATGTLVLEYQREGEMLRLELGSSPAEPAVRAGPVQAAPPAAPDAAAAAEAAAAGSADDLVTSPVVGIFYASPAPESDPFVRAGSQVEAGQTICIIEAMKLMNEVASPRSGVVLEILAENGQRVEFGQPLFRIGAAAVAASESGGMEDA